MMTNYTENILRGDIARSREMKDNNKQRRLGQCEEKSPLIAEMAREGGWRNLWDALGGKHMTGCRSCAES